MKATLVVALAMLPGVVAAAPAPRPPYVLPTTEPQLASSGPDAELVAAHCGACHSIDYFTTQPPKRGRDFWQAEVGKMIRVYGAPVTDADAGTIIGYLAAHY